MWNHLLSRQHLTGAVLLLYFLPISIICLSCSWLLSPHLSWPIMGVGLLLAAVGSLIFFTGLLNFEIHFQSLLNVNLSQEILEKPEINPCTDQVDLNKEAFNHFEKEKQELIEALSATQELLKASETENKELQNSIEKLTTENHKCQEEKKNKEKEIKALNKELAELKRISNQAIEDEKSKLIETIEAVADLRLTINQKQRKIESLETKIHDLTYEIKTLLQIADLGPITSSTDPEPIGAFVNESAHDYQVPITTPAYFSEELLPVHSREGAKKQLKRCIDIAQKITGAQHFSGNRSRFGEFSLDNYTLDLRRLCDSLRSENHCTVFVYSPKEKKLIFANNQIKELLGWPSEKFVQDFDNIVQEGIDEWQNSINQLNAFNQGQTRFVMKAKSGRDLLVHCELSLIPTGVFRNHVIGVLIPA